MNFYTIDAIVDIPSTEEKAYAQTNDRLNLIKNDLNERINNVDSQINEKENQLKNQIKSNVEYLEDEIKNSSKSLNDRIDMEVEDLNTAIENKSEILNEKIEKESQKNNSRIDNIIVNSTSTDGNTELIDIRTAADSTVYETAGKAIRTQVDQIGEKILNIKKEISNQTKSYFEQKVLFCDFDLLETSIYKQATNDMGILPVISDSIVVKNMDTVTVTIFIEAKYGQYTNLGIRMLQMDSAGNVLTRTNIKNGRFIIKLNESAETVKVGIFYGKNETEEAYNEVFHYSIRIVSGSDLNEEIKHINNTMAENTDKINKIINANYKYEENSETIQLNKNKYWNIENGKTAVLADYSGPYYASEPIVVTPGTIYKISLTVGTSLKQRGYVFVDKDYNILEAADYLFEEEQKEYKVTAPIGSAYLLLTSRDISTATITTYHLDVCNPYSGLKLSLLGDSISAFVGTIPDGNKVYYNGTNSGVTNADEMWWSILCNELNMTPLVINAWSGSTVTANVRSASEFVPASDKSRCESLGDGTNNPDVILIAMGVNDYSYNAPIGTWDGTTKLDEDVSTFRTAYATMLERIHKAYPLALVVCITPWFVQRGNDNGTTYVSSSLGLTQQNYADAVKEIAQLMGCPVIDGMHIGFNRYNYYPKFCIDSNVVPTHPNAAGQKVMGLTIAEELKKICTSYIKSINNLN